MARKQYKVIKRGRRFNGKILEEGAKLYLDDRSATAFAALRAQQIVSIENDGGNNPGASDVMADASGAVDDDQPQAKPIAKKKKITKKIEKTED